MPRNWKRHHKGSISTCWEHNSGSQVILVKNDEGWGITLPKWKQKQFNSRDTARKYAINWMKNHPLGR